jgi:hypothetical protein
MNTVRQLVNHILPTTGALLVTSLVVACGTSAADARAAELSASTDEVVRQAKDYVGDPWERRAVAEQQKVPRSVQLAMDRALTQRLLYEYRLYLAENRCR